MSGTPKPYEFDPAKAATNLRKHGVSFDDGYRVLMQEEDRLWQFLDDRDHGGEDRWIVIGPLPDQLYTLLHVTWTECPDGVRIISVRRTTPAERRDYEHRHRRPR